MSRKLIFIFIIQILVASNTEGQIDDTSDEDKPECEVDADCPGGYCYKETSFCSKCTNCTLYNRENSTLTCPRSPKHCGECLKGFMSEKYYDETTSDTCVHIFPPIRNQINHVKITSEKYNDESYSDKVIHIFPTVHGSENRIQQLNEESSLPVSALVVGLFLGVVGVATFVAGLVYHRRKVQLLEQSRNDCESAHFCPNANAPPPYWDNDSPTRESLTTPVAVEVSSSNEISGIHVNYEVEKMQQAHVFKYPDYVNNGSNTNEENINEVEEAEPPGGHEETTQPSFWTPGNITDETDRTTEAQNTGNQNAEEERRHFSAISETIHTPGPSGEITPRGSSGSSVSINSGSTNDSAKRRKIDFNEPVTVVCNFIVDSSNINLNKNNNIQHRQQLKIERMLEDRNNNEED